MNDNSKKIILFIVFGVLFVAVGVVINPFVAGRFLSYRGSLSLIDSVIVGVLDAIFIVIGISLVVFRKRMAREVTGKNLMLLFLTFIMLFALSELSARVIDRFHGGDFLSNKERADKPIIPFRMFGPDFYTEKDGKRYIVGRWGEFYPFKKESGTFRIVALGGSTTQNLAGGIHYPLVLENLLKEKHSNKKIEVINTGNSGYATPHFIILLSLDIISWDPDLIIVSENTNDLLAAYFPNFKSDYSNKYSASTFLPQPLLANQLFNWSRLYWVIKSRIEALSYRLSDFRGGIYQRRSYGDEPPVEAQETFRRNLETIASVARARNISIIFASQPLQSSEEYWDKHMRYKTYNDIVMYPFHNEFVAHHRRYNKIIEEVASKTHSFFVDNNAMFNEEQKYFADFVHYTQEGVERLANNYFDFIVSKQIIR